MTSYIPHQYIDRNTSEVITESLYADSIVRFIYSKVRESAPILYDAVVSPRFTSILGFINFDMIISSSHNKVRNMIRNLKIDISECVEPMTFFDSPRKVFERKIKYWECRPMSEDPEDIVSPADSRMLIGSFRHQSNLFIKEKFFSYEELIGSGKKRWLDAFKNGDYAIFRLTPEKYHYNHFPVSGDILDYYEIDGVCHSCNPGAVVKVASPFSKNRRTVTIIDTDIPGGSQVGFVSMIEVTALMIGDIRQYYSEQFYDSPTPIKKGMSVKKGQPKSVYLPGSSVDVLIFQKDRMTFSEDIKNNLHRCDVISRFSNFFGRPLVETEVLLRSKIGKKIIKE